MARGRPSKKQHIVEHAKGLFQQLGYQGTSIDQVVVSAGVSKPTVYSNFATKQVLWTEVMGSIVTQSETALATLMDANTTDVVEAWVNVWQLWVDQGERLSVYRILLGERMKMEATAVALFAEFEQVLMAQLKAVLVKHEVILSPEQTFNLWAVSKELFLTPRLFDAEPSSLETARRYLRPLITESA